MRTGCGSAVQEREQSAVMERLAQSGHRLARHLDLPPLLDEAAALLRELTGADDAWVVTVRDGRAVRAAPTAAADDALEPGRRAAGLGGGWRGESVPAGRRPRPADAAGAGDARRRAGAAAVRRPPTRRPLPRDAVEILAVFANYVAAAMTNAELYRALGQSETSLRLITDSISDLVAMVDAGRPLRVRLPLARPRAGLRAGPAARRGGSPTWSTRTTASGSRAR